MQDYSVLAKQLCDKIQDEAQITQRDYPKVIILPAILEAIKNTPRHLFVSSSVKDAYLNKPLSIGYEQTISQPFIVALMTSLLNPQNTDIILEIGTGSGYQAAVLAQLVNTVYTIEIIPSLYESARAIFTKLHLTNIISLQQPGQVGYQAMAPYDGIIVTAAARQIPQKLLAQLKIGGKMVLPLEKAFNAQELILITKISATKYLTESILPVRFVPLV